ncbi:hypothetical protein A5731_30615 [Mycolicibacterium conceptionense]|uniref:Uncharacterized protein n=2 Tax=Mycolicibacterium TaxID=1866885 RepID=A0A0U1D317_9MYCO|nr:MULTISPECIES: hypothetical protein [Mycolicibacterium]MCW1819353.1 hypothetical protein [Mycolicibacterium senegalense]OBB08632.1 hypothetical protein A5718_14365 [Mycolicibacterium conceptionense]OBE92295.1 hypothetical protein A5731_30615 [Mycolicibacterium conceptionense]OBF24784.1 hypothetical protein A5726_09175 [Mycolicibacterium conceptionense]OBF45020.1 hypothetical protein A5720_08705 [Mycolicibacterium conceptionense]
MAEQADREDRSRRMRAAVIVALLVVGLGLLLTRCPANRDGMSGQLAQAMEETVAAARSGAYALDLRIRDRSTPQLVSVQISDARDEVAKAFKGIADRQADDPADLERQRMLTEAMTTMIGQLNTASARVREVAAEPELSALRTQLLQSADALETGYR